MARIPNFQGREHVKQFDLLYVNSKQSTPNSMKSFFCRSSFNLKITERIQLEMELPNVFTGILKASPTCARQISCYTAKHGIGIVSYATLVRNCYFTSKRNKLVLNSSTQ